jgi:hypothetical protein
LRTEGRENGDLGAPYSGVPLNLQRSEIHILIRLLQMYFPRNWEFGSAWSKLRTFGGGDVEHPPFGTPLVLPLPVINKALHRYKITDVVSVYLIYIEIYSHETDNV